MIEIINLLQVYNDDDDENEDWESNRDLDLNDDKNEDEKFENKYDWI